MCCSPSVESSSYARGLRYELLVRGLCHSGWNSKRPSAVSALVRWDKSERRIGMMGDLDLDSTMFSVQGGSAFVETNTVEDEEMPGLW